ncbi:pyrroloquinoline-quinone synthase [Paenibacillus sp. DS2015]|uniref:TenA family transcriptional regulator n=1 Tax=Paenibacillus sp. DS2015 TaxID=3373917 RepID=UPI003D2319AB
MVLNPEQFVEKLKSIVTENQKITHPLYQIIMKGEASSELLKNFVLHRYHIKSFWTRNISAIHSKTSDVNVRKELAENIYEEETGKITGTMRHLDLFFKIGEQFGLTWDDIDNCNVLPESQDVINWNNQVCGPDHHLVEAVAALIVYMEGQPPVTWEGRTMNQAMSHFYNLNEAGVSYFVIHSSHDMEVEEDHAEAGYELLRNYAITEELQEKAVAALYKSIDVRMKHFSAILRATGINVEAEPVRS